VTAVGAPGTVLGVTAADAIEAAPVPRALAALDGEGVDGAVDQAGDRAGESPGRGAVLEPVELVTV